MSPGLKLLWVSSEVALQQQDNNLAQLEEEIRNNVIADLESVRAKPVCGVRAAVRATENAEQQLEAARHSVSPGARTTDPVRFTAEGR